jgi:hypothetical protein
MHTHTLSLRELALVSSSIADTVGIMLSDVFGLVLQVRKRKPYCVSQRDIYFLICASAHIYLQLCAYPIFSSRRTRALSLSPLRAVCIALMAFLARRFPVVRDAEHCMCAGCTS